MAVRGTQDVIVVEQQWTSGTLRDTQDALLFELQRSTARVRATQDALLIEWENSNAHLRATQDALIYEYPFINRAMFVYQAAGASVLTGFTPVYPPIRKQPFTLWGMEAVRLDSIAEHGEKRSAVDRVDTVTTLEFDWVALSDMAQWKALEQYALGGGLFAYCPLPDYPGSTWDPVAGQHVTAFSSVKMLSMDWKPKFKNPLLFSLSMKLKLVKDL